MDWRGRPTPFIADGDQYYCYVVAAFIQHDLAFGFPNSYWLTKAPNGKALPKVSMGLAVLFIPSFLVAHAIANLYGFAPDGYSAPYAYANHYFGILVVFLGLFYLRKVLLKYYSEAVTSLTLLSVFIGTNLLYYTVGWNIMPHGYLFTLFVLVVYYTQEWYKKLRRGYLFLLAFLLGYISLIRPTDCIVVLVPLCYGIRSGADIRLRLRLLWDQRINLVLASLVFILPWLPQLLYWKIYSGNLWFYSYGDEGFYFKDPQVLNVLFSYRKGWLIYTPVMVFALAGFLVMRKKCVDHFWSILIVFPVTLYLVSAWWCWWWGGCFGMRALIQYYALLALPMAAFYDRVMHGLWRKVTLIITVALLVTYNIHQTNKYKNCVLHWDSMTREAFWKSFFIEHFSSAEEAAAYEKLLVAPDYSKKGEH
jgi:hypothetical protein